MAQLRQGQKQLCQREENEGGEEKVRSVKTERLKDPGMTKGESEVEGRTMSRGGEETIKSGGKKESKEERLTLTFSRWKQLMRTDRYR